MSISTRAWLDCDHCGGAAIVSESGLFYDGDGDACQCCGMPGTVSADAESDPYWADSQDPDDRCEREDCEACHGNGP